ncbi:MAG: FHA domain-containing protein [candidate division KSB1 bacterium]|nr:FHA domain-containing protein [candidate division KSB1 bacterium]MDZ7288149.1 FHA domain-containing protein [candidate division KSB1 bacterium]MDZ7300338.1 FHA domain-containing protein [candidate division KSB1 bacterium]MDZ7306151.1 FHA domain-containing protein [candidate division KSB1 bacterium]MDZ7351338.1 FHA domain-containing protein [candidate division KSB1 bacterium]
MASLFVTKDDVLLFKVRLRGAEVTIGRAEGNTIRLGDLSVSRCHARLQREPSGDYLLEDNHSTNGIMCNGRKLTRPARLQDGDEIRIGAYLLRFAAESGSTTDHLQALFAPATRKRERKPQATTGGALVSEAGQLVFTITQDRIVLGNYGRVDIQVQGKEPLRASLFRRGDCFFLCSETGAPCVRVNGLLTMNAEVRYNDVIAIGDRHFVLRRT